MEFNGTIGIIGLGNMGASIAKGLARTVPASRIVGYDRDAAAVNRLEGGIFPAENESSLAQASSIIILAVKPDTVCSVLRSIRSSCKGRTIVSIAAGVTIAQLEEAAGDDIAVIRVMPNTPALIGAGMSVLSAGNHATGDDIAAAEFVFASVGRTMILPEKHIDAVTAVSGCGPAYVFTVIQAMADAGVKLGLSRADAVTLASQTLVGSAAMVLNGTADPIALRNMVTSPGGSTIAAVHVLERAGFAGIIMDALEKAAQRSKELGVAK